MSNASQKRITRELQEVATSREVAECGLTLELVGSCLTSLVGSVTGPPDTPYHGGTYRLEITIPEDYPFRPPRVRFITEIWHPNVSSATGAICLDILADQWAATMSLTAVLLSVQALLGSPAPDNPQDAVVARQYLASFPTYHDTAQHWATVYAGAEHQVLV